MEDVVLVRYTLSIGERMGDVHEGGEVAGTERLDPLGGERRRICKNFQELSILRLRLIHLFQDRDLVEVSVLDLTPDDAEVHQLGVEAGWGHRGVLVAAG